MCNIYISLKLLCNKVFISVIKKDKKFSCEEGNINSFVEIHADVRKCNIL